MENTLMLEISFLNKEVEELYRTAGYQDNVSSGFDLINIEDIHFTHFGEMQLVNLGVRIRPPKGFHSILIPRSSLYKKSQVIQTNSMGLIDENYCGEEDIWKIPLLRLSPYKNDMEHTILKGTRICQFFLQPQYRFATTPYVPDKKSRNGFGSTDEKTLKKS